MSDTARNKELVLAWAEALSSNNTQGVLALYADDIHITTMGSTCISGRYGPAQVRGFVEGFLDTFPEGLKMTIHSMTAEDDRVSAEATGEGRHISGQEYIQHYHFLFTIRHNRIAELKEYLDTELITRILC